MTRTILTAAAPVSRVTVEARVTAADEGSRTITGRVLEFGAVGHTSHGPTRFAAGSLQNAEDLSGIKLLIEHDPERVIGYAESITAAGNDLVATFRVAPGPLGDEALRSAAGKLRDGLSVGVQLVDAQQAADGVLDVTAAWLRETSVVTLPAFATSRVSNVAASQPAAPAAPLAPVPVGGAMAAAPAPAYQPRPVGGALTGRSDAADGVVAAMAAAYKQGGPDAMMRAALADIVPPTNAAEHDVMFRPQWIGELWEASETSRPFVDAFGGPRPLTAWKVQGFRRVRAGVVDEYAGNKAEIPTGPGGTVEPIDNVAKRQAGGNDIDRVFFDFGDASFLRSYLDTQTDTYRENTETLFAAAVLADATPLAASADALSALKTVARGLPRGARLNVVRVAADVWSDLMDIRALDAPWLFGGSASLTEDGGTVGGVSYQVSDDLPAGTVLGADRRAATFYEWRNPPLAVQAVNVPNGGVDVGVFGYWSSLINDPAAIVTTTVGAGG